MRNYRIKYIIPFFVILFLSSFSFAQRDLYWRKNASNNNFNNASNWTDSPTGVGGTSPGTYPTISDNVYFPDTSNFMNITVGDAVANMRNLTVATLAEGKSYLFSINGKTLNITGNVTLNGNFKIDRGNINLIDNNDLKDVVIDLGPNSIFSFGNNLSFKKEGGKVSLSNNLIVSVSFTINNTSVYSNGNNITTGCILIGNSTQPTVLDLSGSTLTTTNTTIPPNGSLVSPSNLFGAVNITYKLNECDFISNNYYNFFYLDIIQFKSIAFNHPTATSILLRGKSDLIINDFIINTPSLTFSGEPAYAGKFISLDVSNSLTIKKQSNIVISNNTQANTTELKINNITIETNACSEKSSLKALTPVFASPKNGAISTSGLGFININFDGVGWSAPKSDDLGYNTGNIAWDLVSSKKFYWINGSGNWNDPAHWSYSPNGTANIDKCAPTILDNVYVDDNSFINNSEKITITSNAACKNIYWTDLARKGSLSASNKNVFFIINGEADFSGVKMNGIEPSLYFTGDGNHTITSAIDTTYTSPNIYFQGSGTYTLANDFISTTSVFNNNYNSFLIHNSGILNTNGKKLFLSRLQSISVPDAAIRELILTNSDVYTYYNSYNTGTPTKCGIELDKNNLNFVDLSGSHLFLNTSNAASSNETFLRAVGGNWVFNDITFLHNSGIANFSFDDHTNFINNLTFNSDFTARTHHGFIVDTIILTPNKIYKFAYNRTTEIQGAIIPRTNSCNMLTLTSTSTQKATLKTGFSPFIIDGAKVSYINASPNPLSVNGGIDLGNNGNVTVTPISSRNFYWVGGSGNWSDCSHWSIGESGGNPALNNQDCCLPTDNDSVFFDANSFDNLGQVVTLDISPITINSMIWKPETGAMQPSFVFNQGFYTINIKGSLEWADGMKVITLANGCAIVFNGALTDKNSQTIKTNNIETPTLNLTLSGNGRYDLFGYLYCSVLNCNGPSFYTHGYNIRSPYSLGIVQAPATVLDLSGSSIYGGIDPNNGGGNAATLTVVNCDNFFSEGTNFGYNYITIDNRTPCTLAFNNLAFAVTLTQKGTSPVMAKKLRATISGNTIFGTFITDTMEYSALGSINKIEGGRTLTINNSVISSGTPCSYIKLLSTNTNPAIIKSKNCNLEFAFFDFTNMQANTDLCNSGSYSVLGNNLGGNTGFTFSLPPSTTIYYNDTIIGCENLPYNFDPLAPGNPTSYKWYKNGIIISGSISSSYSITQPGNYTVEAVYPGTGCISKYERKIGIIDTVAPLITCPQNKTVDINYTNCKYINNGTELDPVITASECIHSGLKQVWYKLSGAKTDSVMTTKNNPTMNGVDFPKGITTITWFALDDSNNVASCNFNITVNPIVNLSLAKDTAICKGESIELIASGAGENGSYLWSPETDLSSTTNPVITATPNNSITYTVIATDKYDCSQSHDINITVKPLPLIEAPSNPNNVCVNQNIILNNTVLNGIWTVSDLSKVNITPTNNSVNVFGKTIGNTDIIYTVTQDGCISKAVYFVTVRPNVAPNVIIGIK